MDPNNPQLVWAGGRRAASTWGGQKLLNNQAPPSANGHCWGLCGCAGCPAGVWVTQSLEKFSPPSPPRGAQGGDALTGVTGRASPGRAARHWPWPLEGTGTLLGQCHRGKAGWGRAAGSAPRTQPSCSSTISTASTAQCPQHRSPPAPASPSPLDGSRAMELVRALCLLRLLGMKSRKLGWVGGSGALAKQHWWWGRAGREARCPALSGHK